MTGCSTRTRLQVADFDGDGHPDLYVGEMGRGDWTAPHPPAQLIFLSRGDRMEEIVIDSGVGTHEAQVIELDGRVGIVSKPYRALAGQLLRGLRRSTPSTSTCRSEPAGHRVASRPGGCRRSPPETS